MTNDGACARPIDVATANPLRSTDTRVDAARHCPGNAAEVALGLQHRDDLARRVVAELLAELLLVMSDTVLLDECDEMRRRVARERTAAEIRILRQVIRRSGIRVGEVAATSAGDTDLLADDVIVLDQQHAASALACDRRAHHAGGTGADDDDIEMAFGRARARRRRDRRHYSTGWIRSSTSGRGAVRVNSALPASSSRSSASSASSSRAAASRAPSESR